MATFLSAGSSIVVLAECFSVFTHSNYVQSLVGSVLGGTYQIVRELGSGGMGTVYEALQLRLNKRVAVKIMAHALSGNDEAMVRFRREAEVTSAIGHPHIVEVFDVGTALDGRPFLVMELLQGESLEQRLSRAGTLRAATMIPLAKQVASALAAAHAKGVVHRDLKPANIYLLDLAGETDFVKVLDFGVSKVRTAAKLTGSSRVMGTPMYMSREQAQGHVEMIDERTDQWALACIVWEALSGRLPFLGDDDLSTLYQIVYEAPAPFAPAEADLPASVETVLRRALSKEREERFASMTDFALALDGAVRKRGKSTTGPKLVPAPTLLGYVPRAPSFAPSGSQPPAVFRPPRGPGALSGAEPRPRLGGAHSSRAAWIPTASVGALVLVALLWIAGSKATPSRTLAPDVADASVSPEPAPASQTTPAPAPRLVGVDVGVLDNAALVPATAIQRSTEPALGRDLAGVAPPPSPPPPDAKARTHPARPRRAAVAPAPEAPKAQAKKRLIEAL